MRHLACVVALTLLAVEGVAAPDRPAIRPTLSPLYEVLFKAGSQWTYAAVHRFSFQGVEDERVKEKQVKLRVTCTSVRVEPGRPDLVAVKLECRPEPKPERLTSIPLDRVYIASARGLFTALAFPKDATRLGRLLGGRPLLPPVPTRQQWRTVNGDQREEESLAPRPMRAAGRSVTAWCHVQRACVGETDCTGQTLCFAEKMGIAFARDDDNAHDNEVLELTLEKATAPR